MKTLILEKIKNLNPIELKKMKENSSEQI